MGKERRCLTSGMILHTEMKAGAITITIDTPNQSWGENISEMIDDRLHDSIEYALAPFWKAVGFTEGHQSD